MTEADRIIAREMEKVILEKVMGRKVVGIKRDATRQGIAFVVLLEGGMQITFDALDDLVQSEWK